MKVINWREKRVLDWLKQDCTLFWDQGGEGAGGAGDGSAGDGGAAGGSGAPAGGSGAGGDGGEGDEYFLTVNDRTRFKTQEDAIRSYDEAGRKIAELTPFQDHLKYYGISRPEDLRSLLDELSERRGKDQRGAGAGSGGNQGGSGSGAAGGNKDPKAIDLNSLSAEDRKAVEWLMNKAGVAGLSTKAEIDALREEIATLKQGNQQSQEEVFNQRVEAGQATLKTLLEDAGLPTDPRFMKFIEGAMTDWIEADDRRVKAFYAGGQALRNLVTEGFAEMKGALDLVAVSSVAGAASGRRSAGGNAGGGNVGRGTPPGTRGAANPQGQRPGQKPQQRNNQQAEPDLEDQAWEVFQNAINSEG